MDRPDRVSNVIPAVAPGLRLLLMRCARQVAAGCRTNMSTALGRIWHDNLPGHRAPWVCLLRGAPVPHSIPSGPRVDTPREYRGRAAPAPCDGARTGAILRQPPTPGRSGHLRSPNGGASGAALNPAPRSGVRGPVIGSAATRSAQATEWRFHHPSCRVTSKYGREARLASRSR